MIMYSCMYMCLIVDESESDRDHERERSGEWGSELEQYQVTECQL